MAKEISRTLTPAEEEKLNQALLDAFDADSFEMMLRFKLGKNLDHFVSPSAGFRAIVFEIVKSANREGWLNELINGASAANAGNSQLIEFVDSVTEPEDDLSDGGESADSIKSEYSSKELRQMLSGPHGLTLSELKTVCFELDVEYENFEGGRDERIVGLLQLLKRQGRLQPLIDVLKREYPHTLELFN